MALLGNEIAQEIQEAKAEDFSPVPAGEYILQVTKTDCTHTKDKSGLMAVITFDIIAPSYQGRKLFARFNLRNNSAIAERIGKAQFKALIVAAHVVEPVVDTDQLLGATVKASVVIREATEKYGPSNEIKGYKEVSPMPGAAGAAASTGDAVIPPAAETGGNFSNAFAQPAPRAAGNFKW